MLRESRGPLALCIALVWRQLQLDSETSHALAAPKWGAARGIDCKWLTFKTPYIDHLRAQLSAAPLKQVTTNYIPGWVTDISALN